MEAVTISAAVLEHARRLQPLWPVLDAHLRASGVPLNDGTGGWPGDFTNHDERAYFFLLGDFTEHEVMAALKALRHQKFRPSASEIVAVLTPERAAIPTFDEMFALLFSPRGALAARGVDGTRNRLAQMHPLVTAFAQRQGIQRLKELPVHDEDDGHWRRKELRIAWEGHVEAMEGREVAVLAAGGDPREGLRQLDPLTALNPPARTELEPGRSVTTTEET